MSDSKESPLDHAKRIGIAEWDTGQICQEIERLRNVAEKYLDPREWQPMETAPKDRRVLVWSGYEIYAAHWASHMVTGDEAWIVVEFGPDGDRALVKPILWAPLLAAPSPADVAVEDVAHG